MLPLKAQRLLCCRSLCSELVTHISSVKKNSSLKSQSFHLSDISKISACGYQTKNSNAQDMHFSNPTIPQSEIPKQSNPVEDISLSTSAQLKFTYPFSVLAQSQPSILPTPSHKSPKTQILHLPNIVPGRPKTNPPPPAWSEPATATTVSIPPSAPKSARKQPPNPPQRPPLSPRSLPRRW